ncbi:MAG TPA: formimidoylglutamate deiminase [Acidimicrobiales bacterium]|nr:formimidoylglutamate deiminase [Acidimicrobiales bacterium]
MGLTRYHCEFAYLGGDEAVADVAVVVEDGRVKGVERGVAPASADVALRGLTLPGFANAHSHAFHRVLRGRAERPGTFWSWRDEMYAVAAVLDPDLYRRLARAVYAEMVLAGFSAVGEFHYLHHGPEGRRYEDPNEMGLALCEAAKDAGIRLTLLDTCYLERAPGEKATGVQERYSDSDVAAWAERVEALQAVVPGAGVRVGAAAHSLRAVPPPTAGEVAAWAASHDAPFHIHVSEQPAENDAVAAAYGGSPVALLSEVGALGPSTTAVHATHLHPTGAGTLGASRTTVCMCPTTERALGDGIGVAATLAREGCPIALGTDSHAVIDPFEEARALELDERLESGARGRFTTAALLQSATSAGHAAIGWPGAGRIEPGAPADLVTVSLSSVRLAGADRTTLLEHAVFAACAADITDVVVSGRRAVAEGRHQLVDDVPGELASVIGEVARLAEAR